MREYTEVVRCDMCQDTATHIGWRLINGESRPNGAGWRSRAPREIDLCDDCYDDYVQPLLDMMSRLGRNPEKPAKVRQRGWKREKGPYPCLVPGCHAPRPLKTAMTLETHLSAKHELTLDEYQEQYGPLQQAS